MRAAWIYAAKAAFKDVGLSCRSLTGARYVPAPVEVSPQRLFVERLLHPGGPRTRQAKLGQAEE
jgi:hypothetical protein